MQRSTRQLGVYDDRVESVFAQLELLRSGWPGLAWSWDGRMAMIASSFAKDAEPRARTCAQQAFPRGWTTNSLDTAPPALRAIAAQTGGLRAGQRLLGGSDDQLVGLWWPWGGGENISLRIGLVGLAPGDAAIARLRSLFAATY